MRSLAAPFSLISPPIGLVTGAGATPGVTAAAKLPWYSSAITASLTASRCMGQGADKVAVISSPRGWRAMAQMAAFLA